MKVIIVALALVALAAAAPADVKEPIIVALALVALVAAAPADVKEPPKIVRAEFDQQPDGAFVSSFETENGIAQAVVGEIREFLNEKNEKQSVVVVRGSYSYPRADGSIESINYWGDESGYHAEGDSIPKAPVVARR